MKILNLLLLFQKVIETAYAVLFCPPTSSIVSVGQRTAPSGSGNLLKDCVPASYGNYSCFDMQSIQILTLKYCRYVVKHYPINQSNFEQRPTLDLIHACVWIFFEIFFCSKLLLVTISINCYTVSLQLILKKIILQW